MSLDDIEFLLEEEMTEYFVIREYLECLETKELVELLQPRLTKEEKSQILSEIEEERQEMLNAR